MLGLSQIRFVPSGLPRLRAEPAAVRADRAEMVRLAIQDNHRFLLDEREINRPGVSASVHTLREYRDALGTDASICFAVGADAFTKLDQWVEWRQLFTLCHLIVVSRPGCRLDGENLAAPLKAEFLSRRVTNTRELALQSHGCIYAATTSLLDISASQIRSLIAAGNSARYLLPESVYAYIQLKGLYKKDGI